MKTIITIILTAAISAAAVYFYMQNLHESTFIDPDEIKLRTARSFVENRVENIKNDISSRLVHFSEEIISDRDFSMSLLAHNDPTSPAVTRSAVRYMKPMGFSLLEIVDSESVILSSGHFPANAGNSAEKKMEKLGKKVSVIKDNVIGEELLSLQSRHSFSIADVPFTATGGIIIDEAFLQSLAPHEDVKVILRTDEGIKGMNAGSISPVSSGKITINEREYHAASIDISSDYGICELIIIAGL